LLSTSISRSMMFDKMLNMGHSRFLSHEQNIKNVSFCPHIQQWWKVWSWVWPNSTIFLSWNFHMPISFLCSLLFSIWVMILALGFEILKNNFHKRHCIIAHAWMQLMIVINIQPPQRDWCHEKKFTFTSHVYGMEHN